MQQRTHLFVYWLCQVSGWGFYVLFFGLLAWGQGRFDVGQGVMSLITFGVGVLCSHALRAFILQKRWLDLPIQGLLPRLLLGLMGVAFLATLFQAALHDVFIPEVRPFLGATFRMVELYVGWVVILVIWSALYVAQRYIVRSRREEIRALRMEAADRANQLANLRSQMNPHFMFNALNGIRALVDEDPARAKSAITRLSAILRNAMATVKRTTVPLGEELDMVQAYLELEHMRYEERLRFRLEAPTELQRHPVPPMMLQTLVENAVKHGIAVRPAGGDVVVRAERSDEGLLLTVENTGSWNAERKQQGGIGLQNTRERLKRIYGDKARLEVEAGNDLVSVRLNVPARAEHNEMHDEHESDRDR